MTVGDKEFIFIGAHNSQGIEQMLQLSRSSANGFSFDELWLGFSSRSEEELKLMGELLRQDCEAKSATMKAFTFNHPRALSQDQAEKTFSPDQLCHLDQGKELFARSKANSILVTGSYYFVGEVQKLLSSL
jgi:folylpolyglutamate synthase/dihydropteroate synthase